MISKQDSTFFKPSDLDEKLICKVMASDSGFVAENGIQFSQFNRFCYYSFKVPNGSSYISTYTTCKIQVNKTKKVAYGAILLRKYQEGGYGNPWKWKVVKVTTRALKWKCIELARKWRAQKLGVEYKPWPRTKLNMSEERRAELANRMLDCAGRMHNLPVFDLEFKCSACGHEWGEVTYEHGTAECPNCGFTQTYDKRSS